MKSTKNNNKKKKGGKGGKGGNGNRSVGKNRKRMLNPTQKKIEAVNKGLKEEFKLDLRGPNSGGVALDPIVENPTIPIVVPASANNFNGVIMAVISFALTNGWSINTPDDSYPYHAWVYQCNLIRAAAQGAVPLAGNIPFWLALIVQSVIKTSVSYGTGSLSYNFDITDTPDISYLQPIGPVVFKHEFNMGVKTSSLVNSLWPDIVAPSAYTEELGEQATQNLWLFLESRFKGTPKEAMHKMVPFNDSNMMTKDASAFAWFENGPGGGIYNTGGWFKKLFHEAHINAPIFSVFSPVRAEPFLNRSYPQMRLGAGDSVTLGAMLVSQLKPSQIKMTPAIRPQFVDCLEVIDVYARTIAKAIILRTQTAAFVENYNNDSQYYVDYVQCPLTLLEFSLVIRASLMLLFGDNIALQGIFPRVATSQTDNEFVAYSASIGTAALAMGNMMLFPKVLQENILSLRSRTLFPDSKNPIKYMAVLGQFDKDRLFRNNYMVDFVIDDMVIPEYAFADDAGEVDIDLIDGSYGMGYVAINDTSPLLRLTNSFNEWIMSMGDHFRRLDTLANDAGNRGLSVIGMTLHIAELKRESVALGKHADSAVPEEVLHESEVRVRKAQEKANVKGGKVGKKVKGKDKRDIVRVSRYHYSHQKEIRQTFYDNRSVLDCTTAYGIVDNAWTAFQQFWILPFNFISKPEMSPGDNTGFNRIAGFLRQGEQVATGAGSVIFPTQGARHENYANLMVKTKFAVDTNQEAILDELEREGESGILGKLASVFAADVGHVAVDVGAEFLQRAIPI